MNFEREIHKMHIIILKVFYHLLIKKIYEIKKATFFATYYDFLYFLSCYHSNIGKIM